MKIGMENASLLLVTDTVRLLYEIYQANAFKKRGKAFKGQMNPVPSDLGALSWFTDLPVT